MGVYSRRKRSVVGLLALAASAIFLLPANQASAAEFNNACVNSLIPTQASSIPVTMTANASPNPVKAGNSVTLGEIEQELAIPPAVFIAGYNAGVLTTGLNEIPTELFTRIIGTNTVEEEQLTNKVATEAKTTITDPDETPGTGDETATPGTVSVAYENQTWTAKASGQIEFREKTQEPLTNLAGGIQIEAVVSGIIHVRFGCDPGNVEESAPPETIELVNPAVPFASVEIEAPPENEPPTASAGPDQTVASGAKVELSGSGSTDPNGDKLSYQWSQTGGTSVSLEGDKTATPSFTAPTGPDSLEFELEVCDPSEACDVDSVAVTVEAPPPENEPPTASAGPDQTVASGAKVELSGSGSTDPNGDKLSYQWSQTGGTSVSLEGDKTATPSFTAPTGPDSLEFELEVCDPSEACDVDSVTVTVEAPPKNEPPMNPENEPPTSGGGSGGGDSGSGGGETPGTANAAAVAQVKGGKAFLTLSCRGGGACQGSLQLVARVKAGKSKRAKRSKARARNLTIGKAGFAIPAGQTETIRVRLTGKGKKLLRKAGRNGLKVKLRGSGVGSRTVRLRSASKRMR